MVERLFVRILVSVCLCIALLTFVLVPILTDLPSPAFEQVGLYRLEMAPMLFYGTLLLITPVFLGLTRGRLPTGISTRGARFAEKTDQSAELTRAAIEKLEQTTGRLADEPVTANREIQRLKKEGDSR